MKIERLQSRAIPFRRSTQFEETQARADSQLSVDRPTTHRSTNPPATTLETIATTPAKSKKNPYTKPGVGKCHKCGEPEHKFNECPERRQVDMADYENEGEVEIETEPDDSDFAEEHGDVVTCIIQKLLCNQKAFDTTQRHQIFYSMCSIKNKMCNLIINNESYKNIVSSALVDYLRIEMEPNPQPYTIGWIKKAPSIKVVNLYHVPISIGILYQDSIACEVVNIVKCHTLLGRQWQHDIDAT